MCACVCVCVRVRVRARVCVRVCVRERYHPCPSPFSLASPPYHSLASRHRRFASMALAFIVSNAIVNIKYDCTSCCGNATMAPAL